MVDLIEEMLINADPASDIAVENGFILRYFSNGNLCSINRMVDRSPSDYGETIKKLGIRVVNAGVNPNYKIIHDQSYSRLDQELVRQSYSIVEEGLVMALRIENMQRELFTFANFYEQGIFTEEELNPDWLEDYKEMTDMDPLHGRFFENNIKKSTQDHMYFGLFEGNRLLAMSYVVFIDDYMIIKDIFVDERYRNLDYGKRILKAMLSKALAKNCKVALCEVNKRQVSAGRLLSSEGFEAIYGYHYRAKNLLGN